MPIVAKEDQQRIAAECDQVATKGFDNADHGAENIVQELGDTLGTFAAKRTQPLGERRGAGKIGE